MVRVRFICENCGNRFEMDVFEPGEAREKRLASHPVSCPKCGGPVEKM